MLKRVLSVFLLIAMIGGCIIPAAADEAEIGIYFNETKLELSKKSYVKNDIVMCELQGVFDAIGITYEYLGVSETLKANYRGDDMIVKMGEKSMTVHRVPIELTEPFYRDGNKIMMPLDTVAYCFNLIVDRSDLSHITIAEKEQVKRESLTEKMDKLLEPYNDKKTVAFDGGTDYIDKVDLTQYPEYETLQIVDVEGMPFDKALDITITKLPDNWWEKQISINIPDCSRSLDELVYITFWAKTVWARTDTAMARLDICDQQGYDPWRNIATSQFDLTDEWQKYSIISKQGSTFIAEAGRHNLNFRFGFAFQKLQIADIRLEYYIVPADFEVPADTPNYEGVEDDALWRKEALKSIEKNRKNNMTINVADDKGNPIENAEVHAEMTRSEMNWGCSMYGYWYERNGQNEYQLTDSAAKHQQMLKDIGIQMVTIGNNKPGGGYQPDTIERELNYLLDNDIDYRLHCYMWDGTPADASRLYLPRYAASYYDWNVNNMDKSTYRKIWQDQLNLIATYANSYPVEIDVLNEVAPRHYMLQDIGFGEIKRFFELARKINPKAKLVLNECGVGGNSVGMGYFDAYLELLKYLKSMGAPIDAAGLQAHQASCSYPYKFIEEANLLTQYVDSVSITEFDTTIKEEFLYPYVRDILIACYSHPKIETFIIWEPFYVSTSSVRLESIFGKDDRKLPGYYAWMELVMGEWRTNETVKTDKDGSAVIRGHRGRYDVTVTANGKTETISMNLTKEEEKDVVNAVVTNDGIKLECENKYVAKPKPKYINPRDFGQTTDTDMPALINEYERPTEIVSCKDSDGNELSQLFDSNSNGEAELLPGEYLTVELGKSVDLKKLIVGWGDGYLKRGFSSVIETSEDGENWTEVREGDNKSESEEIDMTGKKAKYIRIKAKDGKIIVSKINVYTDNSTSK